MDVSTSAWAVAYAEAAPNARWAEIDGVRMPFLSREDLIRSKLTHRDQDRADVERLRRFSG
ncbi:MAG: hypothetical protein WDN28_24475 [Chthoniobacter sp.]